MSKWLWKIENEEGLWQDLIRNKHYSRETLVYIKPKPYQSHFMHGILDCSKYFYKFCKRKVRNGLGTRFWEDAWLGNVPFCNKFPRLYGVNMSFNITVAEVIGGRGLG